AAPKEGEHHSNLKPLSITITLPFGQKVQYELTSPQGPAYSQILGPVAGWGKLDEKTFVVATVPANVLKPPGQWTMTAHLIGVPIAPLSPVQVAFQVVAPSVAKPDPSPQASPGGGIGQPPGAPGGGAGGGSRSSTGGLAARPSRPIQPLQLTLAQRQGA